MEPKTSGGLFGRWDWLHDREGVKPAGSLSGAYDLGLSACRFEPWAQLTLGLHVPTFELSK
jgi:hypothetical protein